MSYATAESRGRYSRQETRADTRDRATHDELRSRLVARKRRHLNENADTKHERASEAHLASPESVSVEQREDRTEETTD